MKYLLEVKKSNKDFTLELNIANGTKNDAIKHSEVQGYKVIRCESSKNFHICKYCGSITEGTEKDRLCQECHECFGHYYYSEL